MKLNSFFSQMKFFIGLSCVALLFQNCSDRNNDNLGVVHPATFSNGSALILHDEVNGQPIDLVVNEDFDRASLSEEDLKSVILAPNVTNKSTIPASVDLDRSKIVSIAGDLTVKLVQPAQANCQMINAPASLTLKDKSKIAGMNGQVSIEIGKRFNSCDPYYDIVGEKRQEFFDMLNQAVDKAIDNV